MIAFASGATGCMPLTMTILTVRDRIR